MRIWLYFSLRQEKTATPSLLAVQLGDLRQGDKGQVTGGGGYQSVRVYIYIYNTTKS